MSNSKIHEFSDLDELKLEIQNDFDEVSISANRFPVRFIFLNSHEELKEVYSVLTEYAEKVELSSFLYSEDSWLTDDQVLNNIQKLDKTSIILPLSEYIRFLDDDSFSEILTGLAEIENTNIKLYIPLVGLWGRFKAQFWDSYSRKDNWAPIWKLNTPSKRITIYQVDFDFKKEMLTPNFKLIKNTKEWFELWKTGIFENVISLPKQLSIYFNRLPDNTFTQEHLKNPKEYLEKIFDMEINIPYDSDEEKYWNKLLLDVSRKNKKNISLKDIFLEKANVKSLTNLKLENYLKYYLKNETEPYNQWIIKNFFLNSKKYDDSYLMHCFKSTKKLANINLSRKIFLEIFKLDEIGYSEDYLDERRKLLKYLNMCELSLPESEFNNYFEKIEDKLTPKQQLKYLTDTTCHEKEKILEIISNNESLISELKTIFPELYYYLDWNLTLNDIPEWIIDYFKEYNLSKLTNRKSEKLTRLLHIKNHQDNFNDWYYELLDSNLNTEDYRVWVDGLGAEWLPLFTHFLNEFGKPNGKKVKFKTINAVNLPSATDFNKIDSAKKIGDLDKYIHDNHYSYPKSLLEEIGLIKEIASKIVRLDSPKISVFSDHGFTFLCTKNFRDNEHKKYYFENSKHGGRYFLIENEEYHDNEDYICHETESIAHKNEKYVISLKHVSLNDAPSQEVHGGATPEEVLVPYIVIENADDLNIDYDLSPKKSEINISMDKKLPITISPKPMGIPLAIYNNTKLKVTIDNGEYIIHLTDELEKGKQSILIKIDDQEVGEVEINIKKGGMTERPLF